MKVKEIASRDVYSVVPAACVTEVAAAMKRHGIGAIPVCDGDKVVGVITDRDIVVGCLASSNDAESCSARDCMTTAPVCVSPEMDLEEAAGVMAREQVRRVTVVDNGKLVGMLSLGDVAVGLEGNDTLVAKTLRSVSSPLRTRQVC